MDKKQRIFIETGIKPTKYYICDRKKCKHCIPSCHHTADVMHALYDEEGTFELFETGLYEREHEQKKETSI